ncbi:MAG: glycosyl transferase [Acidobacteria bacterium]|nr:glycosyl transferase [Acidobacteriota bacterium]MBI3423858.1 glycosyl transferase [Acidobacteriota bacterium]
MKKRVLFYCQSLLGIGHLIRSRELLFALRDFDICFLYGGEAVPGFHWPAWVEVIYLPALRSDAAFEQLFVVDGQASLGEVKARRKELLQATFERFAPDILLIELFPFGRKKFKFELLPLLAQARATYPATKIVCSLRDILVHRPDQARYEADVCALLKQYFDLLLVHADPHLQRLEETFGSVAQLACPLRYTGYVAQPAPARAPAQVTTEPLIVVSIGGGRVGHELIACALAAAPHLAQPQRWQIFTGPHMPDEQFDQLRQQAAGRPDVTLERHTTEFPAWLQQAALSISMAGYNTCMDLVSAQVRALVYPFNEHDNHEQTLRARKLAAWGYVKVLEPAQLTPEYLASAITRSLAQPLSVPTMPLDLQGAPKTAALLAALLAGELHAAAETNY